MLPLHLTGIDIVTSDEILQQYASLYYGNQSTHTDDKTWEGSAANFFKLEFEGKKTSSQV